MNLKTLARRRGRRPNPDGGGSAGGVLLFGQPPIADVTAVDDGHLRLRPVGEVYDIGADLGPAFFLPSGAVQKMNRLAVLLKRDVADVAGQVPVMLAPQFDPATHVEVHAPK